MRKTALVLGGGGFIGSHLVKRLVNEGYYVRGIDLKLPEFDNTVAQEFFVMDLRDKDIVKSLMSASHNIDEVYQLAADMGGAGFVFTKEHDADIMLNSAQINLNVAEFAKNVGKLFFSSSACVYPEHNQLDPDSPVTAEGSAYPANPDSDYGWEKLFSERLYEAVARNKGADIRIARFHNVYGPEGTYKGGREKAPAAICRKVAEAPEGGKIQIWGDGKQTRSFMFIDDCMDGVRRMMELPAVGFPLNLGSDEMVTIKELAEMAIGISGKRLGIEYISGPTGVRGRTSDNTLCKEKLGWYPKVDLAEGMVTTYDWIKEQVNGNN
jgi:GDP-D-mannose 3',5'-epimerase